MVIAGSTPALLTYTVSVSVVVRIFKRRNEMQLSNPRAIQNGNHVQFIYRNKSRVGRIERVANTYFVLKHDSPRDFGGKQFSTYKFMSLDSRIEVCSHA